ncbi:MocR-like pyridoxine biosynthesis transcription factor PdxR [Paenibacillus kobensis]|uniref:MocR-like pyridoxine biosynthesis transcription factor PdxR n=1 Tax=Paenibacillus kobensis TaxID=59841 RepID=UPI000FDADB9A|nr:PLP-dependent aminotransferase family protein [Paenibacillus kobensis]
MISLTPEIDRQSRVPLYQQLYGYIRKQIEDGILKEEERIPSVRQMSSYLQVSKNTVETAYRQLLAEGYIHSRLRSRLCVFPIETLASSAVGRRQIPEGLTEETKVRTAVPAAHDVIDFEYGDVEKDKFPLKRWKQCLTDALNDHLEEVVGYGDRQGHKGLRTEIAKYLYQSRGVLCSAEQVFLGAGTQQMISLLCQLLGLSGRVAMEDPGYNGVRTVFANHGYEIVPVPLDPDGLSAEHLRMSGSRLAYVTPSHQFPIGMVMPVRLRTRLLQWAYENNAYLIEDDYDSEFRYQGQPIPALKAMDTGDKVIYLGTFSKSFLPGARLSYAVLPESLEAEFKKGQQVYSQSVSPLIQTATYLFMSRGYFEAHIRRMRKLYQNRHRTLIRAISEYLGDRVGVIGEKSGMHLLLDVHGRDSDELLEAAFSHGVKVYSPRIQWMNPEECPPTYVMLGFAGLTEERILSGVARLRQAWFGESSSI